MFFHHCHQMWIMAPKPPGVCRARSQTQVISIFSQFSISLISKWSESDPGGDTIPLPPTSPPLSLNHG